MTVSPAQKPGLGTVVITGSSGVIGKILTNGLPHRIRCLDLPDCDIRSYENLLTAMQGSKAVVHLAWETQRDNFRSEYLDADNILMAFNVYRAAVECGVRRVIMASSVHADNGPTQKYTGLKSAYSLPIPDSPYGAGKCAVESLGRYYATGKELEVVCLRFGAVNSENAPPTTSQYERKVWLSNQDCVNLTARCIDAEPIPERYSIIYGVSNNEGRVHDIDNPVGWSPLDGAENLNGSTGATRCSGHSERS
ncbi:MAG: NAD-dependent epimerase/dehydratase family protein [Mycobacteriales bacterium]